MKWKPKLPPQLVEHTEGFCLLNPFILVSKLRDCDGNFM